MKSLLVGAVLLLMTAVSVVAAPISPNALGAIARAVGPCGNPCVIASSNGGRIMDFEDAADAIRAARQRLVIDGYCASACMTMADRARP